MPDSLQPVLDFLRDPAVPTAVVIGTTLVGFLGWLVRRALRKRRQEPDVTIVNESTEDHSTITTGNANVTTLENVRISEGNLHVGRIETRRLRSRRPWWRRILGG
jgi:hypothetical protein